MAHHLCSRVSVHRTLFTLRPRGGGATGLNASLRSFSSSSTPRDHVLRSLIIGPPGGGKGTQSERISDRYGVTPISTGFLLRSAIGSGSDLGKRVENIINDGRLVDDSTMLDLVHETIASNDEISRHGWLLDGYPRNERQAHDLDNLLDQLDQTLTNVIHIDVDASIIVDRLKDRWYHPASGRTYNLQYNPPKVDGKDDVTGEDLVQREDDQEETIRARLDLYQSTTAPLLEYYRFRGLLRTIPSPNSDVGWESIQELLDPIIHIHHPKMEWVPIV